MIGYDPMGIMGDQHYDSHYDPERGGCVGGGGAF